jgi:hypothetical protein
MSPTLQFDEMVRVGAGRLVSCSVVARHEPFGPVVEHVQSNRSVMANKTVIVLEGEDVIGRIGPDELRRLTSLAGRA